MDRKTVCRVETLGKSVDKRCRLDVVWYNSTRFVRARSDEWARHVQKLIGLSLFHVVSCFGSNSTMFFVIIHNIIILSLVVANIGHKSLSNYTFFVFLNINLHMDGPYIGT